MPFAKGNTYGGKRGKRASAVAPSPTPVLHDDDDDDDMVDADADADATGLQDDDDDDAATPAQHGDDDDGDSPPTITTIPRRRRGRGGRRQSSRRDLRTPDPDNDGSESGTPLRRRRGRPAGVSTGRGRGGFRGRRKGQQPEAPRVMDEYGQFLDVVNDEAVVDDDAEGNEKVQEDGKLLGGREYRVRTFTIIGRAERLYMLSTEPARCCGFRDSYLFFTKHPKLFKVLLTEEEKKDLIEREILPNSYKGRNIGVVTARSVFREFGARIIVGGRRVTDDYQVAEARANGEVEGELADPQDRIPENKRDYDRNRYVAWFGASEVYRNSGQGGVGQVGKQSQIGKKRTNITVENWQFMHAQEASRFNTAMTAIRRANADGVYDTNTNLMFYPRIMQPTHARWEQIPAPTSSTSDLEQQPLSNGLLTNGHPPSEDAMMIEDSRHPNSNQQPASPTLFTPVPAIVSRNFTVIDTLFTAPPLSASGYPGPDGAIEDPTSGPNGLSSVSAELLDELSEECRSAFEHARQMERRWKGQWGSEAQSALRRGLKIGFNGYPV